MSDTTTTEMHDGDPCFDIMTVGELLDGAKDRANKALGRVQAAQTDPYLYQLLADVDAAISELRARHWGTHASSSPKLEGIDLWTGDGPPPF